MANRMMRLSPEQYDSMLKAKQAIDKAAKPTKYRSRATGGYASAKEARRAQELKLQEKAGLISNLQEQVSFVLIPAQKDPETLESLERPCRYVADFVYDENGQRVVEDCKGLRLPEYVIKRKLMLWVHKIRIRES